jgi:hypothetical protein
LRQSIGAENQIKPLPGGETISRFDPNLPRLAGVIDIFSYFRRRGMAPRKPAIGEDAIHLTSMGGPINGTYIDIASAPAAEEKARGRRRLPRRRPPPEKAPQRQPPAENAPPPAARPRRRTD